jgi:hypothetical protein
MSKHILRFNNTQKNFLEISQWNEWIDIVLYSTHSTLCETKTNIQLRDFSKRLTDSKSIFNRLLKAQLPTVIVYIQKFSTSVKKNLNSLLNLIDEHFAVLRSETTVEVTIIIWIYSWRWKHHFLRTMLIEKLIFQMNFIEINSKYHRKFDLLTLFVKILNPLFGQASLLFYHLKYILEIL